MLDRLVEILYALVIIMALCFRMLGFGSKPENKNNYRCVTIIMVVVVVLIIAWFVYYLYYSDYYDNILGEAPIIIILLGSTFFLAYCITSAFGINKAIPALLLWGGLALALANNDICRLKRQMEYDKGTIYYCAVIKDIKKQYEKNFVHLTVCLDSQYGKMSFSEEIPKSEYANSYRTSSDGVQSDKYKIGDTTIFQMALEKPFINDVYLKKLNYAYLYKHPVIKVRGIRFDYYSVTNPEEYGVNIVWKDVCDGDTVLLHKNLLVDYDIDTVPCKINKPYNWRKVSDYGYIFQDNIYSKEEVENQFPRIMEYVEKYKERNIMKSE